jgi:CHAT domain-containing protein
MHARSLIVSHWSVDDIATAKLMVGTLRASARDPKLSHAEAAAPIHAGDDR